MSHIGLTMYTHRHHHHRIRAGPGTLGPAPCTNFYNVVCHHLSACKQKPGKTTIHRDRGVSHASITGWGQGEGDPPCLSGTLPIMTRAGIRDRIGEASLEPCPLSSRIRHIRSERGKPELCSTQGLATGSSIYLGSSNKTRISSSSMVPLSMAYCNAVLPSRSVACESAPLERSNLACTRLPFKML